MKSIIELAIVTQLIDHLDTEESLPADFVQSLREFATAIRDATLEEAAGVCENTLAHHYMKQVILTHDQALLLAACADCAAAIRALKEQT